MIRFDLLAAGRPLADWQVRCVERVEALPFVERGGGEPVDFLLQFGDAAAAAAAVHGVWRFEHDASPASCAAAVAAGEHSVTSALWQRQADGRVRTLKSGRFAVHGWSAARTAAALRAGSLHWPAEVCRDLEAGTADYLSADPQAPVPVAGPGALALRFAEGRRLVAELLRVLFRQEQWNVGIAERPPASFLTRPQAADVRWLDPLGRGSYLADPFPLTVDGRRWIACERFDYGSYRGRAVAVDPDERPPRTRDMIAPPGVHTSYPYTFRFQGERYCVPETVQAREVALYRCERLPDRWVRQATLLTDVAAVDPTLFEYGGRWWLAAVDERLERSRDLHLWHAEHPFGPYTAHARNPVKIDVCAARPAGRPFVHEGRLYRPAQDCSDDYGARVTLNEIVELTPERFEERSVAVLRPDPRGPFPAGWHTLSGGDGWTLVDGKRFVFSPRGALRTLARIVTRRLARRRPG